jgi:hypothetical protein
MDSCSHCAFQTDLPIEWSNINSMPKFELPRTYGYDLEMYSEDGKGCTLAVSVNKEVNLT